jgi:hypothetical protein
MTGLDNNCIPHCEAGVGVIGYESEVAASCVLLSHLFCGFNASTTLASNWLSNVQTNSERY